MDGYYSMDAVHAAHDQMMKEFGILGEEIENLKAKNKQLKQENNNLLYQLDQAYLEIELLRKQIATLLAEGKGVE